MNNIHEIIAEMAKEIAPDYPNIDKAPSWEQLYAIEGSYKGTNQANEDLHNLIEILRNKLGMTKEEILELAFLASKIDPDSDESLSNF